MEPTSSILGAPLWHSQVIECFTFAPPGNPGQQLIDDGQAAVPHRWQRRLVVTTLVRASASNLVLGDLGDGLGYLAP
jgi:hypothetical protein